MTNSPKPLLSSSLFLPFSLSFLNQKLQLVSLGCLCAQATPTHCHVILITSSHTPLSERPRPSFRESGGRTCFSGDCRLSQTTCASVGLLKIYEKIQTVCVLVGGWMCMGVCVGGGGVIQTAYSLAVSICSLPPTALFHQWGWRGVQFVCVDMLEGSGHLSLYAPGLKCTNTHISVPRAVDDA